MKLTQARRIWARRGRLPVQSTGGVVYVPVKRKSQAGVEYTDYKAILITRK